MMPRPAQLDRDMQKLILVNRQSPGDVVMLTAAVRDLHRCHPNQFLTDVRTDSPELWENNPYLTPLDPADPAVRVIECHYPLIHVSNQRHVHFVHGFTEYLNGQLDLQINLTRLAGDIHLSDEERRGPSPVARHFGSEGPYWLIVAGGKFDFTIKWWHFRRWQAVVDAFRHRMLFVQVGAAHHYHPRLKGVLDIRGKTSLRDLVCLVYHAQGVLCPVTLLMHLSAAVECKPGGPTPRPCVVVAGGREPSSWEAYPDHQFIHTIGRLPCCAEGGCWRSRSVPLGDGDEKDEPQHLCVDVVNNLPRCMDMITPEKIVEAVGLNFHSIHRPRPTENLVPEHGGVLRDCTRQADAEFPARDGRRWAAALSESRNHQNQTKKGDSYGNRVTS
jgi:ADP-heptose:LPS heptosyltransferase